MLVVLDCMLGLVCLVVILSDPIECTMHLISIIIVCIIIMMFVLVDLSRMLLMVLLLDGFWLG